MARRCFIHFSLSNRRDLSSLPFDWRNFLDTFYPSRLSPIYIKLFYGFWNHSTIFPGFLACASSFELLDRVFLANLWSCDLVLSAFGLGKVLSFLVDCYFERMLVFLAWIVLGDLCGSKCFEFWLSDPMRFPILRHRSFDYYLLGNGGFLMSGPKIWSSSSSEDGSRSRGRYSPHKEWDCFFFWISIVSRSWSWQGPTCLCGCPVWNLSLTSSSSGAHE